ncbi:MAG: DUF427 domain-containing protein [Actinomycetota bacterium]|nr:DUF427 domain-containing protein [Actinomycetota bacterium]
MDQTDNPLLVEDGPKRVRTYFGGRLIADTIRPKLVWEGRPYPAYYFRRADVNMQLLSPSGRGGRSEAMGQATLFDVTGGGRTAEAVAWSFPDSPVAEMQDLIRFDWGAMDAWFEEDEQVYVHPRSPYVRVDVLASSRYVEVVLGGVKVAASHQPRLLFETGLPTRYYLPRLDLHMDLLLPSTTITRCPYKGTAEYWSVSTGVAVFEDVVWTYPTPALESAKIAGLACFLNEKVDLYVDGVLQERPDSPFA